ncbi:nuclear transport factor 2 family protein [Cyanobacterium stanieri LEGE 03274]|uniref:Nuclear transport factor 2 family protein n=1 Tax=Cyanobacterium stanieri LEGE 03274 TaxID=1828756 RepID=A0ABR9V391_9CHRO|nr:nuclear transport factor 2 family protein [Cyanobacterium stanieri]MBE9222359.1 nuclear transport factor 2 family protein [Cyanobacterium stanieri LEGE 03274]
MTNIDKNQNLEVVKSFYAALGKGDIPTVLSMLTDDAQWDMPHPREIVPFGGVWSGKGEVKKFFQVMHDTVKVKGFDLQEFLADKDKVIVIGKMKGVAIPTGKEYENDLVAVWTVENGKIKGMRDFMDTVQGIEAFTT